MALLMLAAAAALVLLTTLVRLAEPHVAFFPSPGETATPREFGVAYAPLTVTTSDGQQLHAWSLERPDARARILYFHGNGGNLSVWAPIVAGIARRGFAVFAFDYRGYGLSTGRPTEQGMYRDVDAMVERFRSASSSAAPVVYWGRSLGVAMAAYAATVRAPDGLILESGFPDVRALTRGLGLLGVLALLSSYRFPAGRFLEGLGASVPVLVLHGDDDHVVPIAQGRALFERITAGKQFVVIRGGDHNDLSPSDPGTYWDAVERFVGSLSSPRAGRAQ